MPKTNSGEVPGVIKSVRVASRELTSVSKKRREIPREREKKLKKIDNKIRGQ